MLLRGRGRSVVLWLGPALVGVEAAAGLGFQRSEERVRTGRPADALAFAQARRRSFVLVGYQEVGEAGKALAGGGEVGKAVLGEGSSGDGVDGAPNGISVPRWSLSPTHLKGSRPWASLSGISPLSRGSGSIWRRTRFRFTLSTRRARLSSRASSRAAGWWLSSPNCRGVWWRWRRAPRLTIGGGRWSSSGTRFDCCRRRM